MAAIIEGVSNQGPDASADPGAGRSTGAGALRGLKRLMRAVARYRPEIAGLVWVGFWLIFLVPTVLTAVRSDLIALTFLLIGALAYLVGTWFAFSDLYDTRPARLTPVYLVIVLLATIGATWRIQAEALGLLPYLAVTTVCTLRLRVAWPLVGLGLLAALAYVEATGQEVETGLFMAVAFAAVATGMGFAASRRGVEADRLREQTHALEIQDERNRMARDLHDILGHSLTVISLKADLAGKLVDRDPASAKRELGELQSLARSALADVRATVNNYREISLSAELVRARSALDDAGIRAELPTTVDDVDPGLRELFAWAVREATTNVVRHSGAARCSVELARDTLTVTDDGRGPGDASDGNGLDGLRERALRAGAIVETRAAHPGATARPGFVLVVREV